MNRAIPGGHSGVGLWTAAGILSLSALLVVQSANAARGPVHSMAMHADSDLAQMRSSPGYPVKVFVSTHPVTEPDFAAVFPLSACSGNALKWRVIAAAASPHIVAKGNLSTRSARNLTSGGNLFRRGINVRTRFLSWCDRGPLNLRCVLHDQSADGTGGPDPPPRYVLLRPWAGRANIHGSVCRVSCLLSSGRVPGPPRALPPCSV
jgi:hypothetical protein